MRKPQALLVMPPGALSVVNNAEKHWLARGRVTSRPLDGEMLQDVLPMLGMAPPATGLAALRHWGQVGKRSGGWCAAADPVHLETRLHHLRVRALPEVLLSESHMRRLFATLQAELGSDGGISFSQIGACGYIHAEDAIAVSPVSARVAHGCVPDEFTPGGDAAKQLHRLQGELQLLLHDHEVNEERAAEGLPVINSLWFWGGGVAPLQSSPSTGRLPVLYANDPLFTGYWLCHGGDARPWTGDTAEWIKQVETDVVAVFPELIVGKSVDEAMQAQADCLRQVRRIVSRGDLRMLTIRAADELQIEIRRRDVFRVWRRIHPLLSSQADDD